MVLVGVDNMRTWLASEHGFGLVGRNRKKNLGSEKPRRNLISDHGIISEQ